MDYKNQGKLRYMVPQASVFEISERSMICTSSDIYDLDYGDSGKAGDDYYEEDYGGSF